ncbi:hypothetical protein Tco_1214655 [Tanacetum coccineum]
MTDKTDKVLKAITDRIAGALPGDTKQSDSYDEKTKENEEEEKDSLENIHVNPSIPPDPSVTFITKKVLKFNSFFESLRLVPQSFDTEIVCTKWDDGEVVFIELIRKNDDSIKGEPEEEGSTTTEGVGAEYFDIFPTRSELAYHKTDEVAYKMPNMIDQYNSLSNLEKKHTKSVYLRNEEDKRRGVEYVMSKLLGFYKECLELGPKYVTGMDDEGEIM